MSNLRTYQAIFLSSAAFFAIPAAHAQTTAALPAALPAENGQVEEIVVTAQRRTEKLQEVPISVSVTTGVSLEEKGTTDLVDLSERVPGIKLSTDPQSNHINIRGVGSGLNAGFEQSVGTFVDDVYRSRSRTIQSGLFDVERVEVLNGPQTTFFGNNTVAGAINITSRKPSPTFGYDFQTLYSPSDGQYLEQGAITGPISDTLSARAALQVSGMNGYIRNENLQQDEPGLRDLVGRISFRWKPTENFQSDFRVDYAHNDDKGTYSAEVTGCPPPAGFPAAKGPCAVYLSQHGTAYLDSINSFQTVAGPSSFGLDMVEAAWTNRLDLDTIAITSITSYSYEKSNTFLNATPLPVAGVAGYYYSPFTQNEKYTDYAEELRVESQGDGWFQYMGGIYYSHGNLASNSYSSLFGSPTVGAAGAPVTSAATPIGTNRNLYQIDQTRSIFAQGTAHFTSDFRLNAGLRYTDVKKDANRTQEIGIGGPTASPSDFVELDPVTEAKLLPLAGASKANFFEPSKTYSKLMPSASLQYDIIPDITAYVSYTKGFKAGGFSDSNTPAQFNSESVNSYEIGIKGSEFSRKLFFTLDGFYEDYAGLQQALTTIGPTGASISTVGNAATSDSEGVEFSGTLRATTYLSFNLAGAEINSHFVKYTNAGCTALGVAKFGSTCVQDLSGEPTPFAPRFSGSLGATLTLPVTDQYRVRLEPSVYYSTGYFLTPTDDPIVHQNGYAEVDMRAGFMPEGGNWEIAVIGKNLNNQAVIASGSTLGTSPGLAYLVLQRARSVAISFSIHD